MSSIEQAKDFSAEAQKLRSLAQDPSVPLDVSSPGMSRSVDFQPGKGDKGLSFLAKRLYQEAGYDSQKALSAALMLSAQFVEKMGPDPHLQSGDRLIIDNGRAQLMTGLQGSQQNIVEVFLNEEARQKADERARAPQLGLNPIDDPEQMGVQRLRTVEYQPEKDTGFRSLIMRLYQESGYGIQASSVASNALYGAYMQKMNYPPHLEQGDRLSVGPEYSLFTPQKGPQVRVDFGSEALSAQYALERGRVATESHQDRTRLVGTISETPGQNDLLSRYNEQLSTRLVGIPNAIVFGHGNVTSGVEFCKVAIDGNYYSVLENSRTKTYKLIQLDSVTDDRVVTGPTAIDWTTDFDSIQDRLA